MKESVLKKLYRYDATKDQYYIDVQLDHYGDAYSDWDYAPFAYRDMNDGLTSYLLECSKELLSKKVVLNFHVLEHSKNKDRESRSIRGIYHYFEYKLRGLRYERMREVRETFVFFIIGFMFLSAGTAMDRFLMDQFFEQVISEGMFIGGWVMVWEMFSKWLFDIRKISYKMKRYKWLTSLDIVYSYPTVDEIK